MTIKYKMFGFGFLPPMASPQFDKSILIGDAEEKPVVKEILPSAPAVNMSKVKPSSGNKVLDLLLKK